MRLQVGQKAPKFEVEDLTGKTITLEDFKDKMVLISFYRYASCPLCNLRISQLISKYNELHEKGLYLIAFFQSPKESMEKYVGTQQSPFPLIPDPERKIYRRYKVEKSWVKYILGGISLKMIKALKKGFKIENMEGQKNLVPADFLVDNTIIKKAFYGRSIAEHLPIKDIEKYLAIKQK